MASLFGNLPEFLSGFLNTHRYQPLKVGDFRRCVILEILSELISLYMELIKKMFGGAGDAKTLTCEKCGKEKTEDQGKHICGENAEKKDEKEGAAKNVCEFC